MNKILCLLALSFLSACVAVKPLEVVELPEFDQEFAKKQIGKGKNTITGSAFLKQLDGRIQKCSGSDVELVPATEYAKKRMNILYALNQNGRYTHTGRIIKFKSVKETDEEKYWSLMRKTICDIDGKFEFENVHDGSFFIISDVVWGVVVNQYGSISSQGGPVMLPVTVKDGEIKKVVVTR